VHQLDYLILTSDRGLILADADRELVEIIQSGNASTLLPMLQANDRVARLDKSIH
jgi:hypothetical protein